MVLAIGLVFDAAVVVEENIHPHTSTRALVACTRRTLAQSAERVYRLTDIR